MKEKVLNYLNRYLGFYQEQVDDLTVIVDTYAWKSPEMLDFIALLHEKINEIEEVIEWYKNE